MIQNIIMRISFILYISLIVTYSHISWATITPLPKPLSEKDAALYKDIFSRQEDGNIKAAEKLIKQLDNHLLIGHVLAQKYLHPTAWRSRFSELSNWLDLYYDHPAASRIKWLSNRRKPASSKAANAPKKGYLNGVGLSRAQNYRAQIPESRVGRSSPLTTAKIARDIRRAIRRGHPSGANALLNNPSNLRYLTAGEEAHLRGEIAHAYFIFGVDDKAVRTARQAIAKSPKIAYMGYWAGGLAAWRAKRFELATDFFVALANLENTPDVLRAGAAFWAQRGLLLAGQPKQAMDYLAQAANYDEIFYGIAAISATGQTRPLDFTLPTISPQFIKWLQARRGGRRTLGLLQIGNWTEAARELRYLFEELPPEYMTSMISFARLYNMPGLSFRLADIYENNTGIRQLGALYPILKSNAEYRVDKALIMAMIRKESGFYPLARSRVRATGLMQLMPATAAYITQDRRFRKSHLHKLNDPDINIEIGQDYIEYLLQEPYINGDLVRMLAAYNGGPGNLRKWLKKIGNDDPFLFIESIPARETRNYIKGVLSYLYIYQNQLGEPITELQKLIAGQPSINVSEQAMSNVQP